MGSIRFRIIDSSKRNAAPCAFLTYGENDELRIEISESSTVDDVPAFFIPFVEKDERVINGALAMRWLRERIVPSGRQNLGEVLKAAELNEYSELALLRNGEGRSSQDSFLVQEIEPSKGPESGKCLREERRAALGAALKARRVAKGLSQKELADRVSMKQPALSKIESGNANPTFDTLSDLDDSLEAHGNRIVNASSDFLWNKRREEVFDLLLERWPDLAYIYERLVNELGTYDSSGATAVADSLMIAHGLRELMNSVPECLGSMEDVRSAAAKEREARTAVEAALEALGEEGLEGRIATNATAGNPLNKKLAAWATARHEGTLNMHSKASQALYGDSKRPGAAVRLWLDSHHFAHRNAHYHRDTARRTPPQRVEYLRVLEDLEDIIHARFGVALDAKHRLQQVVAKANRVTAAGDYESPTEKDIHEMLALSTMNGLERLLFSELRNPKCLKALKEQGVFRQYGTDIISGKKAECLVFAPYLERCASSVPDEVCDVLRQLSEMHHPSFVLVALDCAASLPGSHLVDASRMICDALGSKSCDGATMIFDPQPLEELLYRMISSKDDKVKKEGKKLLSIAIRLTQDGEDRFLASLSALVDEYEYRDFFDACTAGLSDIERLDLARTALVEGIRLNNAHCKDKDESFYFIESLSDEALSKSSQSSYLVALAAICKSILAHDTQDFWGRLESVIDKKPPIMKRIALQVLHERLQDDPGAEKLETESYALLERIVSGGFLLDREYQREALPLLKDYGPRASEKSLASFFEQLDERLAENRQKLAQRYEEARSNRLDGARYAIERTERIEHRILQQFEKSCLPPEKLRRLRSYERKHGGQMEDLPSVFGSIEASWAKSPVSAKTLALMKADDLFAYLKSWVPSQADRLNFVTRDRLASELSKMVGLDPFALSGYLGELKELHPAYVRGVLSGWEKALQDACAVPLREIIDLAHWAILGFGSQDSPSVEPIRKGCSERYQTKRAAAWLIEKVAEKNAEDIDVSVYHQILEMLEALSKGDREDPEEEEGDSLDDAFLQALGNQTRLIGIAASLKLLPRCSAMTKADREALHRIVQSAMPAKTESAADVFALALGSGSLFDGSEEFLEECKGLLFDRVDEDAMQQKLLSMMLFVLNPHPQVIAFLRKPIGACLATNPHRIASFKTSITKKSFMQVLGDWLYWGVFWNTVNLDEPLLQKWLASSTSEEKGAALQGIGQGLASLSDPSTISEECVVRVKALWDRIDAQHGDEPGAMRGSLGLAKTGRFDPAWLRSKMMREASGSKLAQDLSRHTNAFLALAEDDPRWGMQLLETLPEDAEKQAPFFLIGKACRIVIDQFIVKGGSKEDPALVSFMNWVARRGDLDIDEYVQGLSVS